MQHEIKGTVMPIAEVRLTQGEAIYTETGGMAWMSEGISMKTSGKGGLGKMLGRAFSGESMFLTTYTCDAAEGMIVFAADSPGHIIPITLQAGQSLIAQRGAFLAAQESVQLQSYLSKKFGSGLFGGEGFVLQQITGPGIAFVTIDGEVQQYQLGPGQTMKINPGHIAMYEPSVSYDIQAVKGVSNVLFGGEGLFLATLKGPGRIWLQTMPISHLAAAIIPFVPSKGG
jgi:uncharacterized protein (TIGR00266 family)